MDKETDVNISSFLKRDLPHENCVNYGKYRLHVVRNWSPNKYLLKWSIMSKLLLFEIIVAYCLDDLNS